MRKIDVSSVIDNSSFTKTHAAVLGWCILLILFDGYDLVVFSSIISTLKEDWAVSTSLLGTIGSLTLIGSLVGSFICGVTADKIGRKNVIIACVVIFSIFTLLTGMADSIFAFAIFRFFAGVGLGGIPPLLVTLTSEYSPKRMRNIMVGIMFSGYSIGGICVALLGIWVIPNLGWQWMFFIGAIPLLLLPFMIKSMPESIYYHVKKGQLSKAQDMLSRLNPAYVPQTGDELLLAEETKGVPVTKLFKEGRAKATILFWVICFMGLLLVYGLSTWLPQMMMASGFALTSSLLFLLTLNIGAIIGSVTGGFLADRIGSKKVLATLYSIGGICLVLLAFNPAVWLLYILVAFAGAASIGAQNLNNAFISSYYPPSMRSTGLGTALSIGRIGAIIGPSLGGFLLTENAPAFLCFIAFAIPAFIAAFAISLLPLKAAFLAYRGSSKQAGNRETSL
jgi:MFS transporter, AAHS family, benzoate transport protein